MINLYLTTRNENLKWKELSAEPSMTITIYFTTFNDVEEYFF